MAGLRKEKDTDGRMIWQPSMVVGQPSTLLGYAVAPAFEDMATYTTTGALAIAVGDMNAAYQIVRRQGMRLLRDPYSSKPFIEFYATQRVGGGLINGHALKLVKFAA
jgi:HK97 family phage major capsid protein